MNEIEPRRAYLILEGGARQARAQSVLRASIYNSVVAVELDGVVPGELAGELEESDAYQLVEWTDKEGPQTVLKRYKFGRVFDIVEDPYLFLTDDFKAELLRPGSNGKV